MALEIDRKTDRALSVKPDPLQTAPKQDRRTWWMTLFLLCAILGAMLALSVRTQQAVTHVAAVTGADILQKQVDDLQRTTKAQQAQIAKYEAGASSNSAETRALSADLKTAKFVAGLTSVQGPGVEVILTDSKKPFNVSLTGLPPGVQVPNIIHDIDINQTVNELKQAGAEAISVNDQRLVATSAVRCAGPTVYVNNTQSATPFVIKAIGDPKTLEAALNIAGGEADQIKVYDKAMFSVQIAKHLVVPAYSGVTQPKYALPVPPEKSAASEKSTGA